TDVGRSVSTGSTKSIRIGSGVDRQRRRYRNRRESTHLICLRQVDNFRIAVADDEEASGYE
ncbi:hypothetical protein, partial [Rhodococcus rhodochrous]|uniref:hypothetical protein n=1 Tax=Rhodococcus rhodochrous TaxID=1829 RepID=UPI002665252C